MSATLESRHSDRRNLGHPMIYRRVFVPLCMFVVAACTPGPNKAEPTLPSSEQSLLRARFHDLQAAEDAEDVEAVYAMYPPRVRQKVTLEEYKKKLQEGLEQFTEKTKKEPPRVRVDAFEKVCSCGTNQATPLERTCAVLIRVTRIEPEGLETKFKVLDSWVHVEGEWYHLYTDHHKVNDCPY